MEERAGVQERKLAGSQDFRQRHFALQEQAWMRQAGKGTVHWTNSKCPGVIAVPKGHVNWEAKMEVLMPEPQIYVEKTLALIKPDVIHKEEEIEDIILRSGFTIVQYVGFTSFIGNGECLNMSLSLRALYGTDELRNGLHGSLNVSSAEREIRFMFPEAILEPVPTGQRARDYLNLYVKPTLLAGLTALCKKKPADPMGRVVLTNLVCHSTSSFTSQRGMKFVGLSIPEANGQQPCGVNKDVFKTVLYKRRNRGKRFAAEMIFGHVLGYYNLV
ncbi:hypothetical protein BTVI_92541 [Pitangus sulphuratus]|nr:hypothetical protein BTVI_92541 [Pitangus sulphuratus]